MATRIGWSPGPAAWNDDLAPIAAADWNYDRAAHLLAHAGFGGTPAEIQKLADLGLERAVRSLVHYESIPESEDAAVCRVGAVGSDAERIPGEPSRSDRSRAKSTARRWASRPSRAGNRPVQPVSDRFFYWLRATMLETRRLGYWWANRMLQTTASARAEDGAAVARPLRDPREQGPRLPQDDAADRPVRAGCHGQPARSGDQVAQNPAMLYFLDAQYNVKGAPNENFAREVMELFTMGVGNYTEKDVRECARAFTGWYFDNLAFKVDPEKHDGGAKTFLGRTGNFDGVDVLKIIFEQPVTAEYLAAKIYRFLVRDELSPDLRKKLGAVLRDAQLRSQAAADGDPLVEGLLQPGELRRPHQGTGRAPGRDDEAPGRRRDTRVCPTSINRPSRWASIC